MPIESYDTKATRYGDILREFYAEMGKQDVPFDQLLDFYSEELLANMPYAIRRDCIKLSDFTEKDWKCLIAANTESGTKVSLGVGHPIAKERGTLMGWANARRSWAAERPVMKGKKVRLDANEMIIPCSKQRAERIGCYINELPVYYQSLAAKMRGEVSSREALSIFTEGHLGDYIDKLPKDEADKLRLEIRRKGWGFFFRDKED